MHGVLPWNNVYGSIRHISSITVIDMTFGVVHYSYKTCYNRLLIANL